MQRVEPLHAGLLVRCCKACDLGCRQRAVRGTIQKVRCVRPAVRIGTLRVLNLVRSGSSELELAGLAQFDQNDDGFSFETHAGLGLVVEWSLDGADVEIEPHDVKLRLSAFTVERNARNA